MSSKSQGSPFCILFIGYTTTLRAVAASHVRISFTQLQKQEKKKKDSRQIISSFMHTFLRDELRQGTVRAGQARQGKVVQRLGPEFVYERAVNKANWARYNLTTHTLSHTHFHARIWVRMPNWGCLVCILYSSLRSMCCSIMANEIAIDFVCATYCRTSMASHIPVHSIYDTTLIHYYQEQFISLRWWFIYFTFSTLISVRTIEQTQEIFTSFAPPPFALSHEIRNSPDNWNLWEHTLILSTHSLARAHLS